MSQHHCSNILVDQYINQCAVLLLSWIIVDNSSNFRFERKRVPNFEIQLQYFVRIQIAPEKTYSLLRQLSGLLVLFRFMLQDPQVSIPSTHLGVP